MGIFLWEHPWTYPGQWGTMHSRVERRTSRHCADPLRDPRRLVKQQGLRQQQGALPSGPGSFRGLAWLMATTSLEMGMSEKESGCLSPDHLIFHVFFDLNDVTGPWKRSRGCMVGHRWQKWTGLKPRVSMRTQEFSLDTAVRKMSRVYRPWRFPPESWGYPKSSHPMGHGILYCKPSSSGGTSMTIQQGYIYISGWWFGCHFLFSHILGISSSQLTNIFQRGGPTTNQIYIYILHGNIGDLWLSHFQDSV